MQDCQRFKVAFLVSVFPCLSETFILNQITGLMDLGYSVDIFASVRGEFSIIHPEVLEYNLLSRTKYFCIPHNFYKIFPTTQAPLLLIFF